MRKATVLMDRDFAIGQTDPRLFGAFVEHLGRCVYGGIYEPGHPTADEKGFRHDVLGARARTRPDDHALSRRQFRLGLQLGRRRRAGREAPGALDLAWFTTEPNTFGTNEFIDWCRAAGVEPMLAVNLGTRGGDAARNLIEYCNHPGGTYWSDLRREHGWKQPHDVKFWCLGNEMDGPWQMEYKTADEYGRVAKEAAKMMSWIDPASSSPPAVPPAATCRRSARWEDEVLEHTFEHVDYISLHTYLNNYAHDTAAFLASPDLMDQLHRGGGGRLPMRSRRAAAPTSASC